MAKMWSYISLLVVFVVYQASPGNMCPQKKCQPPPGCYPDKWECDGIVDCWKFPSDEMNCDACKGNHTYHCQNEQKCITKRDRCDGHWDCAFNPNSEDEENCDECFGPFTYHCGPEQRCILGTEKLHRCDGHHDCAGNETASDEQNCTTYCNENDRMFCNNESTRCIPTDFWCDKYHTNDCPNGEDENDCTEAVCTSLGKAFCAADEKCIDQERMCEGHRDCSDGSDEEGCTECKGNHAYHCTTEQKCIHGDEWLHRCDGHADCTDDIDTASDEQGCDTYCDDKGGRLCNEGGSTRCIPTNWFCDGYPDCPGNEDEDEDECDDSSEDEDKRRNRIQENKQKRKIDSQRFDSPVRGKKERRLGDKRRNFGKDKHEGRIDHHKSESFEKRMTDRIRPGDKTISHYAKKNDRISLASRRQMQENKQRMLAKSRDEKLTRKSQDKKANVESKLEGKREENFEKGLEQTLESLEARLRKHQQRKNIN